MSQWAEGRVVNLRQWTDELYSLQVKADIAPFIAGQFTRIALYIQVVLGVVLYILLQQWTNMRFTGEHVVIALLAVGAVEFGSARAKKSTSSKNMFRFAFIGTGLALVLIYVALLAVGGIFT